MLFLMIVSWFTFVTLFWLAPIGDYWLVKGIQDPQCLPLDARYMGIFVSMCVLCNAYSLGVVLTGLGLLVRVCRRRARMARLRGVMENLYENIYGGGLGEVLLKELMMDQV
jgi:hypothetical protein